MRSTLLLFAVPLLLSTLLTARAAAADRLVFFERARSGSCDVKAWDPKSKTIETLKTVATCPATVRADGGFASDDRRFFYGLTPVSFLFIDFDNGRLRSANLIKFPNGWMLFDRSAWSDYRSASVGRFDDTNNPGIARENQRNGGCVFEFLERVGGRWKRRPNKPCSYGDFGGARFGWETKFVESEPTADSLDCGRAVLGPPAYSYDRGVETGPYKVTGGIATRVSKSLFRIDPNATPKEEAEGVWYYRQFKLPSGRAIIFYDIVVGDYVHVNEVFLKPGRSANTIRLGRGQGEIVGKYILLGSKVTDIETGKQVFKDPTPSAFWTCYR